MALERIQRVRDQAIQGEPCIAALTISIVTLLVSAVVGLAVMELLANGTPSTSTSDQPDDVLTKFELSNGAIGTALSEHGLPRWLDSEAVHVVLFVSPVCSCVTLWLARSREWSQLG